MNPAQPPGDLERRAAPGLRAAGRGLTGRAMVWGAEARIGSVTEVFRRGAFQASLASNRDVLCLVDHQAGQLLGRTSSGTLRLTEDDIGLSFDLDLPQTTLANDILALAERGDLGGVSVAFRAVNDFWPSRDRREVRVAELHDVSVIVSFPAYRQTSLAVRSQQRAEAALASLRRRLEMEMA